MRTNHSEHNEALYHLALSSRLSSTAVTPSDTEILAYFPLGIEIHDWTTAFALVPMRMGGGSHLFKTGFLSVSECLRLSPFLFVSAPPLLTTILNRPVFCDSGAPFIAQHGGLIPNFRTHGPVSGCYRVVEIDPGWLELKLPSSKF